MSEDNWISPHKVLKITRLIDQQIALRTNQLLTFAQIKRAVNERNVRGQLRQSDLDFIKRKIKKELK